MGGGWSSGGEPEPAARLEEELTAMMEVSENEYISYNNMQS